MWGNARFATALALLALAGTRLAISQPAGGARDTGTVVARKCFGGRPLPHCRSFWLTEFGGGVRISPAGSENWRGMVSWELGGMRNLSPKVSIGGAGFWILTGEAGSAGLRPRLRYWLNDAISFDVAPGIILVEHNRRTLGFSGQLAANAGSAFSLVTTVQSIRPVRYYNGPNPRRVEVYVGARLGGKVGAVTGVAAPLLSFLALLALCSQVCD